MRRRPMATETGWALAKLAVVVVALGTLAGFTVLSHLFSHARAERIACIGNQHAMQQALVFYEAENAGNSPATLETLRGLYSDPSRSLGRCPANWETRYSYSPESGTIQCPNPAHRPGP